MRLTSYNMAVKILHAKGCLADMVDRMWGYMEEGDAIKAQCAREKALGMYALIETASRWSPTITDGKEMYSHIVIASVNQPQLTEELIINGIKISYGNVYINDIDDSDAVLHWSDTINGFISENDDIIQLSIFNTTPTGVSSITRTSMPEIYASSNDIQYLFTTNDIEPTSVTTDFEGNEPLCLTDAQILSVIEKIDELCKCNC